MQLAMPLEVAYDEERFVLTVNGEKFPATPRTMGWLRCSPIKADKILPLKEIAKEIVQVPTSESGFLTLYFLANGPDAGKLILVARAPVDEYCRRQ